MPRKTKRRMSNLSCTKKCVAKTIKDAKHLDKYKEYKREKQDIDDLAVFFPKLNKISKVMEDSFNNTIRTSCKKRCAKK